MKSKLILAFFILIFISIASAEHLCAANRVDKAIVVAGSGPYMYSSLYGKYKNNIWDAQRTVSNLSYQLLRAKGFYDSEIMYISADKYSTDEGFDSYASLYNLEKSITQWASDANNVTLYINGHGGTEIFLLSTDFYTSWGYEQGRKNYLYAEELDEWLDTLQSKITGRIIVVYDACYSGSFIPVISDDNRIIITASKADQVSYFGALGYFSFSMHFWSDIFSGMDAVTAYLTSKTFDSWPDRQTPQININGTMGADTLSIYAFINGGVKYFINKGHYTISPPANAYTAKSMVQAINDSGGNVTKIYRGKGNRGYDRKTESKKGDFYIEPGEAYYIQAKENSEWYAPRQRAVCLQNDLKPGRNLLGFPDGTGFTAETLTSVINNAGGAVEYIEDVNQQTLYCPDTCIDDLLTTYPGTISDFDIVPGEGYIVNTESRANINLCSCDCPGSWEPVCGTDWKTYRNTCSARCAQVDIKYEGQCTPAIECISDNHCGDRQYCTENQCKYSPCPDEWDPVCAKSRDQYGYTEYKTYKNRCFAYRDRAYYYFYGECPGEGRCTVDSQCTAGEFCSEGRCAECDCSDTWEPVCGADGRTYPNACSAQCVNISVQHEGVCLPPPECLIDEDCDTGKLCSEDKCVNCGCPDISDPVCGADGRTYQNTCQALCAHVDIAYQSECVCTSDSDCSLVQICNDGLCQECTVFEEDNIVCGADGNTYPNPNAARCMHVDIVHEGECCSADNDCSLGQTCNEGLCEECESSDEDDPVCGVDGDTYPNPRAAQCQHVEIAYTGECRLSCDSDNDCPIGQLCRYPNQCKDCDCYTTNPRPVCGVDGKTYPDVCDLWCAHVGIAYKGECRP